ncbi:hypothetical protein HQ584_07865 [Patescibacteria group bacterium]|nr:hypothetical protein [Patescibacteria group bacterium]
MKKVAYCLVISILFIWGNTLLAESPQNKQNNESAEERTMPRFFLDYGVVDHSLKNDEGYSMELLELYEKNPNSAVFIADFWHQKALRECEESIRSNSRLYSNNITLDMTKEERDEVMKPAEEAAIKCLYGYYYDNWNKINESIINKLKAENINYRRNTHSWFYILLIFIVLAIIFFVKRRSIQKVISFRKAKWRKIER